MEENPLGKCFYGLKTNCTEHPAQATSAIPKAKQNREGLKNEQGLSSGIFLLFSSTVVKNEGCGRYFTKRKSDGREMQSHALGFVPQSIPTSLCPSRAPGAQMLCQDKAPVFNSSCASKMWASQLYQIPIISEKIKATLSKILFFWSFLCFCPPPPFRFSLPFIPPIHPLLNAVIHLFTPHTWRRSFLLSKPWEHHFILIRNEWRQLRGL